jgi:hypothetical protein
LHSHSLFCSVCGPLTGEVRAKFYATTVLFAFRHAFRSDVPP